MLFRVFNLLFFSAFLDLWKANKRACIIFYVLASCNITTLGHSVLQN